MARCAAFPILAVCMCALPMQVTGQSLHPYLHAPAVNQYARHDPYGTTILPDGRFLRPSGRAMAVGRWPHGLALTADGRTAFVPSEGSGSLITAWDTAHPLIKHIVAPSGAGGYLGGEAFTSNGRTLYWSTGESGQICVIRVADATVRATISVNGLLNGRRYRDSFVQDLALSSDNRYLYCADLANFRLAIVDTSRRALDGSVDVGRYPYAL
ncbi:MAG TPA: hypothetical protein VGS41_06755, partial [Chthonomonadales bacterium]|nr:hypothetical protein [Chthonomonadales bacterium]